jgi:beta-lactam-binding protein with PASTA domain
MSQGRKISLVGGSWSIRLRWQWCLCACLAGAIFFVSGCAKVAVPNVEGLTQDDATAAIIGAKLKVGTNTQQTSNTVAAGKVISQDPASGSSLAEGSLVNLVISSGPQMVTVPNVKGLTQDAGTAALTAAKLKVGIITQKTSNTVAAGKVISQDGTSENSLAEGSPVNLVISSGPQMVAVPNVEGLTQDAATAALTAAKLKVGTNTQQTSNTVAAGKVISQDPASGSSLAEGSLVNLVISSGPQMVTVPNVKGLTQDAATAALTAAKLKVGTNTQQSSTTVAAGKVISQDAASGSSLAEGSPVNLVISSGPQMVAVPNVEGLTQDAATAVLIAGKLKVGTNTQQTSNTVATGKVISQDGASGSSLAEGSPVNLVISSGPQMVAVPNMEGLTQDDATTALTGAKLKVGIITQQTSNTVATGKVISQDGASGSSLAEGSSVNLVISSGPQMVAVPTVEGLTQDDATTAITAAQLKAGTVTQQASNTVASGRVIGQDAASGSSLAEGSSVNLVISSGPQMMVAVPNVEGLTQAAATTAITGAKLMVGTVTQQFSNTVAAAKVISQDPASGISWAEGSSVNLVISSGPQMVTVPNVEELTQDAATTTITGTKLMVGTVTQQISNTVATGKVIGQDPTGGSTVTEGSPVNLMISSGPQMVAVPHVEGLTPDAATATITDAKLLMGTVTQQTSNTVATGNVISQDPASGSSAAEGSPVNLVISSGPRIVAVPNAEGLTQDDATTALTGAKLKVGIITQRTSNTVATGNVISQDPASGSSVTEGSPVNLIMSSGPQMVTVPNVEGLTQAAAATTIIGAKLKVGSVGKVISQDPARGSSVAQGSSVKLVISLEPQMVTVPGVEGLTQAAATVALTAANLTVGTVTQQTSNTMAAGKVISQDPTSGSSLAEGSPVNLVISSGPQMVAVPNLEGLTQDAATTAITEAKLTVGTVTQQSSNTVVSGKVISQDPASGSSVAQGSPVNLVISSG